MDWYQISEAVVVHKILKEFPRSFRITDLVYVVINYMYDLDVLPQLTISTLGVRLVCSSYAFILEWSHHPYTAPDACHLVQHLPNSSEEAVYYWTFESWILFFSTDDHKPSFSAHTMSTLNTLATFLRTWYFGFGDEFRKPFQCALEIACCVELVADFAPYYLSEYKDFEHWTLENERKKSRGQSKIPYKLEICAPASCSNAHFHCPLVMPSQLPFLYPMSRYSRCVDA